MICGRIGVTVHTTTDHPAEQSMGQYLMEPEHRPIAAGDFHGFLPVAVNACEQKQYRHHH